MEKSELLFLWRLTYYAAFTLLLFNHLIVASAVEFEAHTPLFQVDETNTTSSHGDPFGAWSRSQHKGRTPKGPGSPSPGSTMAPTVSGWVLCSSCMSVTTPLHGIEADLLCPHPPPRGGPWQGTSKVQVSSTFTGKDGSFRLTANPSYAHLMNRCAVIISKSSDSNCDIPPPTGSTLPVSVSSTSSPDSSGPPRVGHNNHCSLGSFSFRPASCPVHKREDAAGKPRSLLQNTEESLGMEQDPEKRSPSAGADPHGGEEEPAVAVADHHQSVGHRRFLTTRMKE